ncbi:hypothetical protein M758_12G052000 [Ceratodon purpureus]|nr:hypothetical protein M758_12G052000 [Ceratodon purpureus]
MEPSIPFPYQQNGQQAQAGNGQHSLTSTTGSQKSTTRSQKSRGAIIPCMCAPTHHPGSFRCRRHRAREATWEGRLLPRPNSSSDLENLESNQMQDLKNISSLVALILVVAYLAFKLEKTNLFSF